MNGIELMVGLLLGVGIGSFLTSIMYRSAIKWRDEKLAEAATLINEESSIDAWRLPKYPNNNRRTMWGD